MKGVRIDQNPTKVAAMSINLHACPSAFTHASRILKETRSAADASLVDEIHIVAIWREDLPEHEWLDQKRQVWRVRLRIPEWRPVLFWKALRYAEWQLKIFARFHTQPVKLVNCHHLAVLLLGCLFKAFCGSAMVYDTHELETETVGATRMRKLASRLLERALVHHADAVVAVNESIADWYRGRYGLPSVYVARNVPYRQQMATESAALRDDLGLPTSEMLFIYQGGLDAGRGIEILLDVFAKTQPCKHIVFMGFGALHGLVREYEHSFANVHFHAAVSPGSLGRYTSGADVGVCVYENRCLNHYFCLPNKVFEYVMAGLPIIVSDFPEMGRLVDDWGCGWKVAPDRETVSSLITAISWDDIRIRKVRALQYRQTLGWHKEEAALLQAYRSACAQVER